MRSLPIDRPTLDDPLYSQKNPYQTFLLSLCVISSWPLLRGEAGSATLERELSDHVVAMWGACLLVGSLIALVGEFWRGHDWVALVVERTGLALVALASIIYSGVVWGAAGTQSDVSFVAGLTAAWGAACAWRCMQITRRLRWIRRLLEEIGVKP